MRIVTIIFNIILISIIISLGILYYTFNTYEAPSNISQNINFIVQKGQSLNSILNNLKKHQIIDSAYTVKFFVYFNNLEKSIKAGEYQFPAQISPKKAISMMVNGETITHKITAIEGKTVHNVLKKIKNHTALSGDITIIPSEGTLMADTYFFERDMTRDDLIKLMQKQQYQFLMNAWEKRAQDLPIKTPAEALILASIVEKETGITSERNLVASVFVNRLRKKCVYNQIQQ